MRFPVDSFYYKTFARLALLPYVGGTIVLMPCESSLLV